VTRRSGVARGNFLLVVQTSVWVGTAREDGRRSVANGKDVRIGGGPTVVRDYLKAGLVDWLHVATVPILLGRVAWAVGGL